MPSLEYVVRPYQTPNAHGQIIIPSTPSSSRERATLTWGAKATMPSVGQGISFEVVCCKENLDEQKRTTSRQRVYQNNDSTSPNWVDWDRAETVNLNKKEQNSCGDDWDQISGAAAEIDATLAQYAAGFAPWGGSASSTGKKCDTVWKLKNDQ